MKNARKKLWNEIKNCIDKKVELIFKSGHFEYGKIIGCQGDMSVDDDCMLICQDDDLILYLDFNEIAGFIRTNK
jgi:hypothetical protein